MMKMAKVKPKKRARGSRARAPGRSTQPQVTTPPSSSEAEPDESAVNPLARPEESASAASVEPEEPVVEPEAATDVSAAHPEAMKSDTPPQALKNGPIGWTPELTAHLKAAIAVQALAVEVDQEAGHLAAGLIALVEGQFELAGLNLWHAGLASQPAPTVEEGFR